MPSSLNVPRFSCEELRKRADRFLRTYNPRGTVPVPIEEIAEFEFGIDIVPLPGLHQGFEIDGFISSDLSTISVDEFVYESRPGRYRFTLAHELAHAVLHRKVYEAATFSTIREWKQFVAEIDLQDYEWLEWQAYSFAGLILVPSGPLKKRFEEAVARANKEGLSISKATDVAKQYIASWLAKAFNVSNQAIEKRLGKEGLWSGKE